jgi:hypothetical protein
MIALQKLEDHEARVNRALQPEQEKQADYPSGKAIDARQGHAQAEIAAHQGHERGRAARNQDESGVRAGYDPLGNKVR